MTLKEKICAIIVTYNRKNLLIECLEALRKQTRVLDGIYIIDNCSTDGTAELLKELGYISRVPQVCVDGVWEDEYRVKGLSGVGDIAIHYVRMGKNVGGAGGFYEGVKRGYERGYDWLWLMDDDAEPKCDSLKKLVDAVSIYQNVFAFSNLKVSIDGVPQCGHRGWIDICGFNRKVIRGINLQDLKSNFIEIDHSSFVGLMVSKKAVEVVGLPNKLFFFQFDDVEYCFRLRNYTKIILVIDSVILHKDSRNKDLNKRKILFFKFTKQTPYNKLWLKYYGIRNLIYMKKVYCSYFKALIIGTIIILKKVFSVLLRDDNKYRRIKFYISSVLDGLNSEFDNNKPHKILYS